jgi:hypothetical protein
MSVKTEENILCRWIGISIKSNEVGMGFVKILRDITAKSSRDEIKYKSSKNSMPTRKMYSDLSHDLKAHLRVLFRVLNI